MNQETQQQTAEQDKNVPTKFTKEWIRNNWDHDRQTASAQVQLVKAVHEIHIALPGVIFAIIVCAILWQYNATDIQIILTGASFIGGGYGLFFPKWWCSTLSGVDAD